MDTQSARQAIEAALDDLVPWYQERYATGNPRKPFSRTTHPAREALAWLVAKCEELEKRAEAAEERASAWEQEFLKASGSR